MCSSSTCHVSAVRLSGQMRSSTAALERLLEFTELEQVLRLPRVGSASPVVSCRRGCPIRLRPRCHADLPRSDVELPELPQEPPHTLPTDPPAAEWPTSGRLEFKNISLRYRPELPLTLLNFSATVEAQQKVERPCYMLPMDPPPHLISSQLCPLIHCMRRGLQITALTLPPHPPLHLIRWV